MSIKINFRLLILLLGTLSFFSCFTHNKPEKLDSNLIVFTAIGTKNETLKIFRITQEK